MKKGINFMSFCTVCGAQTTGNEAFCISCGAPQNADSGQYNNNEQYPPQPVSVPEAPPAKDPNIVSTWMYIGLALLFSVPVIGLIVAIVFAVGGTANPNIKNYARAMLIMEIIGIVIALFLTVAVILFSIANPYIYSDIVTQII